ncbi:hypothetical protein [Phenylobacterium soli]|nr:hypothetical protein [Phenylobacterium soli]
MDERLRAELHARRAEARAVAEGVEETLGLERRRGAAFTMEGEDAAHRQRPYRRQPGLDWLARKGRITENQKAAGLRYRDAFIIAQPTVAIGSTLEVQPSMGGGGLALTSLIARAGRRQAAEAKLALYRRQLSDHPALVAACDLVCGRELTPREAAGGEREGLRLEAQLVVALDLLAGA